jgi:hypothetical protein
MSGFFAVVVTDADLHAGHVGVALVMRADSDSSMVFMSLPELLW